MADKQWIYIAVAGIAGFALSYAGLHLLKHHHKHHHHHGHHEGHGMFPHPGMMYHPHFPFHHHGYD